MKDKIKYCECGCGVIVKNRFIHGHHARIENPMSNKAIRAKHAAIMCSEKVRNKISASLKGKSQTEESKRKRSEALTGRDAYWMFGDKNVMNNPEARKSYDEACANKDYKAIIKKIKQTNMNKYGVDNYSKTQEFSDFISGENHPNWKGGITPERQDFYISKEWKDTIKKVWKRDNANCQHCGVKYAKDLKPYHIHHIVSFQIVDKRCDLDNLILLCKGCHNFVHSNKNTEKLYLEVV